MKTKKLIALLLALVMVVGLLPTMALADDTMFIISPAAAKSGEILGDVNIAGTATMRTCGRRSRTSRPSRPR